MNKVYVLIYTGPDRGYGPVVEVIGCSYSREILEEELFKPSYKYTSQYYEIQESNIWS